MQPLRLRHDQQSVDTLYNAGWAGTLDAALVALGFFVTGHAGYALIGGHAMRVPGSRTPLVGPDGPISAETGDVVPDPVLKAIGVEWLRGVPVYPVNQRARTGILILRAGLLARILDRSYAHLEPRESGGQRTLQHQLVRACFVESYGAAEQVRSEAAYLLDESLMLDLSEMHRSLTTATMKAAKLMGGHGYLLGETNSMEFLSLCLSSIATGAAPIRAQHFTNSLLEEAV